ncbi:hypothetical protein NC653_019855 [Populus alba x Populus x berolinensis]|uniref:Uncharacterized protein n=1 Tax=Populus alba x Populus x berolinensis TaxID=444605 RepID=A0AAD6MJ03_9ROSI|nr:hypothetical protein NC653_019855 [Populus alba x Populus x berolinensis]
MAAQVSPSLAPLLLFARISGLLAAALVISWALVFKSSFLPQSTSQEDLIYACSPSLANGDWFHSHQWRKLALVVSVFFFFVLAISAILVHKWLPGSREFQEIRCICVFKDMALACGNFLGSGDKVFFMVTDGICWQISSVFSILGWVG